VGIYEHPTRKAPDKTIAQLHAEVAHGALADAGLSFRDIDGYACAGDAPGLGPLAMIDYMNLRVRHMDSTDTGGSSYLIHVMHAAEAIATGKADTIRDIYAKTETGTDARWSAMSDGDKALEAIRMMSQGDAVTEQGKLWSPTLEDLESKDGASKWHSKHGPKSCSYSRDQNDLPHCRSGVHAAHQGVGEACSYLYSSSLTAN
jgi:acetyl-CoA acetyltransferase